MVRMPCRRAHGREKGRWAEIRRGHEAAASHTSRGVDSEGNGGAQSGSSGGSGLWPQRACCIYEFQCNKKGWARSAPRRACENAKEVERTVEVRGRATGLDEVAAHRRTSQHQSPLPLAPPLQNPLALLSHLDTFLPSSGGHPCVHWETFPPPRPPPPPPSSLTSLSPSPPHARAAGSLWARPLSPHLAMANFGASSLPAREGAAADAPVGDARRNGASAAAFTDTNGEARTQ